MSQHLLMIEDDARLAAMVGEYLEQNGFSVSKAPDGLSGLARLNPVSDAKSPELVILDLMLPDIDGYEVLRRLRAARVTTPILILSGLSELDNKIKGLGFGADDYLTKPIRTDELISVLRRLPLLRRKRA